MTKSPEVQMKTPCFSVRTPYLVAGASLLGLLIAGCNKQPSVTEAPMVAPPAAALPMATGAAAPVAPAPVGAALPRGPSEIAYSPRPPSESYGYIDRAYSMGQAFADTPPDYTVDYQGTRPWIWRAGNGAYRIVERLPQGERYYYYEPGQDQPFFVQDPDYGYAYDNAGLAGVYGPDGAELADVLAARRADEAARYLYRARELYRAAQYEQRQSAYASEWARRRDDLQAQDLRWQQEQARNADWRSWHDAHAAQVQQQWQREREQRAAYAAAIGVAVATTSARPASNPAELARRQASYFSNWNASRGQVPASSGVATRIEPSGAPQTRASPAPAKPTTVATPLEVSARESQATGQQAKIAEAKVAEANVAQAKAADAQRREIATAQATAAQAQRAQQLADQAKRREAVAAQAKAAQAQRAQQLAGEAKQHEAAAAQAKAAEAKASEENAAKAKLAEAKAAQAKAAQAQQAQEAAAKAKERGAAAAQAKATEAKAAEAKASEAKTAETKAAVQAKVAQAKEVQAKARQKAATEPPAKDAKDRRPPKDRQSENPQ
jgi:hypothetical protein